jgi:hypothetical protein
VTVRSDVLAVGTDSVAGFRFSTVATVSAGQVWLLKGLTLNTGTGAAADSSIILRRSGGAGVFLRRLIGATLVDTSVPWHVLEAGDSIEWSRNIPVGSFAQFWASGAKLEL